MAGQSVVLIAGAVYLTVMVVALVILPLLKRPSDLKPGSRFRVMGRTFYVDGIELQLGESYATARVNGIDQTPEEVDDPTAPMNYWELGPYTVIGDQILRNV